jgi:hypothetical protein
MAFTEFCCKSGGSNLNAGTLTGNSTEPGTSADFTYASGNWVASTGVFTVASGNPSSDGVAVGDFASVYADGSTVTGFVGRVTARDATTITVSLTAKSGTAPTDGTGNRTLKIGGAWQGPNAAVGFPINFVQQDCTNSSAHRVRVNFKNDQTYSITANIATVSVGVHYEGYTSSYGDGGRATIDGGTSGAAYTLVTQGNLTTTFSHFIFKNNGASSEAALVTASGGESIYFRCVFADSRGAGLNITAIQTSVIECEAYGNNISNTASRAGFVSTNTGLLLRCISHDNLNSNGNGFIFTSTANSAYVIGCIADSNSGRGFYATNDRSGYYFLNCEAYNNGSHGMELNDNSTSSSHYIENCNFIKNGGWGLLASTYIGNEISSYVVNCGFGAGTEANTSGTASLSSGFVEIGTVIYPSNQTPWVNPANGDFRINIAEAKGTGRGNFTQTAASYAGTVSYPDIGAAQHVESIIPINILRSLILRKSNF